MSFQQWNAYKDVEEDLSSTANIWLCKRVCNIRKHLKKIYGRMTESSGPAKHRRNRRIYLIATRQICTKGILDVHLLKGAILRERSLQTWQLIGFVCL
jgi:hypothetical protein